MDHSVLMVCVIWTKEPKAHEMQPGLGGCCESCYIHGEGKCHGHSEGVRRNIQTQKTLAAAIPNPKGFLSVSALCNKQEQPDADPAAVFTCMGRRE